MGSGLRRACLPKRILRVLARLTSTLLAIPCFQFHFHVVVSSRQPLFAHQTAARWSCACTGVGAKAGRIYHVCFRGYLTLARTLRAWRFVHPLGSDNITTRKAHWVSHRLLSPCCTYCNRLRLHAGGAASGQMATWRPTKGDHHRAEPASRLLYGHSTRHSAPSWSLGPSCIPAPSSP